MKPGTERVHAPAFPHRTHHRSDRHYTSIMKRYQVHSMAAILASLAIPLLHAHGSPSVPLDLSRPDGQPGDGRKPVKVYILAGQSNMVGMGDLTGARPQYARMYYSADPAIMPGATPVGRNERGQPLDTIAVERLDIRDGQFEVPVTGSYRILGGEVVTLEAGKRYSVPQTGARPFWVERVDIPGNGDLTTLTKRDKKFPYLIDDEGKWTARADVTYTDPRLFPTRAASPLSATSNNGKSIGPEVGFGWVMGTFHDEQVLLIKSAMGNRSLNFDFRPPASGRTAPDNDFEGYEYRDLVKNVRDTLAKIDKVVPGYAGQGYEIAGFSWFQGHKDSGSTKEEYEKHLVNLIRDLRKDLDAPEMKAVVATVGFHGYRVNTGNWKGVWEAQMAIGDPKQHPEFVGNVASVDTRDFWREVAESPTSQDYHYNRNPESYLLIGEAMGRAMVTMVGGEAAEIPKSDREAKTAAAIAAEAAKVKPTEVQIAAHLAAIRPLILESALPAFVSNPRNQPGVQAALKQEKPVRKSPFLNDLVDDAVQFYQAAGVRDYDWMPFGGDVRNAEWEYFGFDLPGHPNRIIAGAPAQDTPKPQGKTAALNITLPNGMENWFALEFDTKKAGWKAGPAPFGESAEKVELPDWISGIKARRVPKTVLEHDVLLLRQSFDLPPFKEGFRYRIRVEGSIHNNMGGSYVIYVNGRMLADNREGVTAWRRQGSSPRGVMVYPEFRELFKDGKALIAVGNFAMEDFDPARFIPPGQALSVWVEEQKLPPLGQ